MDRSLSNTKQLFNSRLRQASSTMFYATVKAVDQAERTCEVEIDGVTFSEVLLTTTAEKVGVLMLPAIDSSVLVSSIGGSNQYAVVMFSQVSKIMIEIGDKVTAEIDDKTLNYKNDKVTLTIKGNDVNISADNIVFNEGHNGGLVKVNELTTEINKLVTAFNSHTHTFPIGAIAVEGSPAKQANIAPIIAPKITSAHTSLSATTYENTKTTH